MAQATRPRAFHAIVDQIRADIFARRWQAGDRLPSEQLLGEQFGVSRTGVREALRVLELQGLIEVRHGYAGGVFVAEPGHAPMLGALEVSLRLGQADVAELYQARLLFEPAMMRLAVERDADALAAALAENVRRTEEALAASQSVSALNREFHLIVAQHAGNRVLALVMQALQELLESLDERRPNTAVVSRCALREHRDLLRAVRARDVGQVESRMQGHLSRLEGRVRRIDERLRPHGTTAPAPISGRRAGRGTVATASSRAGRAGTASR